MEIGFIVATGGHFGFRGPRPLASKFRLVTLPHTKYSKWLLSEMLRTCAFRHVTLRLHQKDDNGQHHTGSMRCVYVRVAEETIQCRLFICPTQSAATLPFAMHRSLNIGHSTILLTNIHPISSHLISAGLLLQLGVESFQRYDANTLKQPKQPQTATRAPCPDFSFSHSRMPSQPS
jgi:hypothetical protein